MFTGIIEETGTLISKIRKSAAVACCVKASKVLEGTKLGDSIAVDGVCLTVTKLAKQSFTAQVMLTTWEATTLKYFRVGQVVNLERAMLLGDRLDGHIVQGHVDLLGRIRRVTKTNKAFELEITSPPAGQQFIAPKGSIAINGVSLTVQQVLADGFSVAIIPHTAKATNLHELRVGSLVNLETDMLLRGLRQKTSAKGS